MPEWMPGAPSGSSPLTRGKRAAAQKYADETGLIPAHAGKTRRSPEIRGRDRAHPRSRGENMTWMSDTLGAGGSSPLTRGKLVGGGVILFHVILRSPK